MPASRSDGQPDGTACPPNATPLSSSLTRRAPCISCATDRSLPLLARASYVHRELGVDYEYDFEARRVTVRCPELGVELRDVPIDMGVEELVAKASPGDKPGGWPDWVQGAEYPACPTCGARMGLVFQLDSEDNLPTMFGDMGCGHVTQCSVHRDVLAFGWACG